MASLQPRGSPTAASSSVRAPAPSSADRVFVNPSRVLMQADSTKHGKRRRRHGGDDDSRASKKQPDSQDMMQADSTKPGKRRRRHGGDEHSRASKKQAVARAASPVAHLSCARIRPFVHASRPKQQTQVSALAVRRDALAEITKQNTVGDISCKKIDSAMPTSRPRPTVAVQPSGLRDKVKVPCAGVLRDDRVIKKQEAGKRVQAAATKSIPSLSHPASETKVRSAGVLRNEARGVTKMRQEASRNVQATVMKSIQQIRPPAPASNHQDPFAPQEAVRAALAVARQALDRRQQNVYREQREQARRELDKVVRTVFFNDPYITYEDALKP